MCLLHRGLRPEAGCQGLLGGSRRARARADLLDLVVVACPLLAVERRRSVGPELVSGIEAERPHQPEVGADRRRGRRREPPPGDRWVRRRVGHRRPEAVAGTDSDDESGDALADSDAVGLCLAGRDRGQRCRVRRIEDRRGLSRQVVNENRVGSRGHRRLGRRTRGRVDVDREGPIPALHRQHRVVDRNRHVREDHVALGRRQRRRTKRLRAYRIPVRDIGVRWARRLPVSAARRGSPTKPYRRRDEQGGNDESCLHDLLPSRCIRTPPWMQRG